MIVGSLDQGGAALLAGKVACPGCVARLRPHGHARHRTVRGLDDALLGVRPRRARCEGCGRTQVLLPSALSVRRADSLEVIGTALAAQAAGSGHRRIAALLGRPVSTVRRWLRGASPPAHAQWLYEQAVKHAFRLNPDILVQPKFRPSLLGWGLNILAGAALTYRERVATVPHWTLIGYFTQGKLLDSHLRT